MGTGPLIEALRIAPRALAADAFGDDDELAIELTYRATILRRVVVQPAIQYILNPQDSAAAEDALAFALRVQWQWERTW